MMTTISFMLAKFYMTLYTCVPFFAYYALGQCREDVRIPLRNPDEHRMSESLYRFENDTQKCDKSQWLLIPAEAVSCDPGDLDVTFSSVAVLPNGTNMYVRK